MVPTTFQPETANGQAAGFRKRKQSQQLNREWNFAAAEAMKKSFIGFIERLYEVCVEEYNKNMDEQREKLKPLLTMQTKIQVKKIHTDAWHDGKRYEIVLVDENAEPLSERGQGKQNSATLD